MTTPYDVHSLSGAYAVDALDDIERAGFERHLAECADCRAEVAGLREAAALLAEDTATDPPAALRDRVLADIKTVRPLPPQAPVAAEPVAASAGRRHGRGARLLAAAAAVVVLGGGAAVVWQQPWQDESSQAPTVAQEVLTAPDARSTSLDFPGGAKATVTHSDSMGKAVLVTEEMPPPPDGMVYQLWLDQPVSGMVLGRGHAGGARPDHHARGRREHRPGRPESPSSPRAGPTTRPRSRSPCSTSGRARDDR